MTLGTIPARYLPPPCVVVREVKEMMSSEVGCRVERRLQPNAGKEGSGPPGEALITTCPGLGAAKNDLSRPLVWPSWATGRRGPGQIVSRPIFNDFWTYFGRSCGAPGRLLKRFVPGQIVRNGAWSSVLQASCLEVHFGTKSYRIFNRLWDHFLIEKSIKIGSQSGAFFDQFLHTC